MRKNTAVTLAALVLAIALAGFAVIPGITHRPAGPGPDAPETIVLAASGASYLSPVRLTEITGASIQVTETIRKSAEPGYPQIAVWKVITSAYDTGRRQQLEPTSGIFAFDRANAELIDCCNENINGNSAIQQAGVAGWVFPPGARPRTYDVFDPMIGFPEPFRYTGTDLVDGIRAYQFTEKISAVSAGTSPLLRADPQRYSVHRTYWIDPVTGALLKISEDEDLYLVNPATGATVVHVFDANLSTTPAAVASLVSRDAATPGPDTATVHHRVLFLGAAGVLAVIAGALFLSGSAAARPRRPLPEDYQ